MLSFGINLGPPTTANLSIGNSGIDLGAGLVGGLFSSMPIGPINLIVLDLASRSTYGRTAAFLFGVVSADVLVAAVSLGGLSYIEPAPTTALLLGLLCAAVLFAYGMSGLLGSSTAASQHTHRPTKSALALLGFALCSLNPLFPAFWLAFIAGYMELFERHLLAPGQFLTGIAVGDVLWFSVLSHTAGRLLRKRSSRLIPRLRQVSSVIILAFSLYLFMALVKRLLVA